MITAYYKFVILGLLRPVIGLSLSEPICFKRTWLQKQKQKVTIKCRRQGTHFYWLPSSCLYFILFDPHNSMPERLFILLVLLSLTLEKNDIQKSWKIPWGHTNKCQNWSLPSKAMSFLFRGTAWNLWWHWLQAHWLKVNNLEIMSSNY